MVSQACLIPATPSISLLWLYPFAKRFTDYLQIVLGLQISIGALVGMVGMSMNPLAEPNDIKASAGALYASLTPWTVVYDIVYARQDIKDDAKAGVISMAVRFQHWTKPLLWSAASTQAGFLVLAGLQANLDAHYLIVSCGETALGLATMLMKVKLDEPEDCMWWFKNAGWQIGIPVVSGLLGEFYLN